ncbi:ATP-binding protein [Streptomyces sp. PG2]
MRSTDGAPPQSVSAVTPPPHVGIHLGRTSVCGVTVCHDRPPVEGPCATRIAIFNLPVAGRRWQVPQCPYRQASANGDTRSPVGGHGTAAGPVPARADRAPPPRRATSDPRRRTGGSAPAPSAVRRQTKGERRWLRPPPRSRWAGLRAPAGPHPGRASSGSRPPPPPWDSPADTCAVSWRTGDFDPETCDNAVLVTSELVTNAVMHTASDRIVCRLRTDGDRIRIEVEDESRGPTLPEQRISRPDDQGGRGLMLVGVLSSDWGVRDSPYGPGRIVWAELIPEGPDPDLDQDPALGFTPVPTLAPAVTSPAPSASVHDIRPVPHLAEGTHPHEPSAHP